MLVDSHCHLYYEPLINNIQNTINECKSKNINILLSISVDLKTSLINIDLANKYKEIFCSIGIHPNEVEKNLPDSIEKIKNIYKKQNKIIAIGEIGLDYSRNFNRNKQLLFFEKQIQISTELGLPVIIHTRDSDSDTLSIIKNHSLNFKKKFLIHCFSGNISYARSLLDLGCYISFSGLVTFKNAIEISNAAKYVPLDRLLVETDSPYLSPHPLRGKTNYPKNVILIANKIAELKNVDVSIVENYTTNNFYNFFDLNK